MGLEGRKTAKGSRILTSGTLIDASITGSSRRQYGLVGTEHLRCAEHKANSRSHRSQKPHVSSQEFKILKVVLISKSRLAHPSERLQEVGESWPQVGENSRGEGGIAQGSDSCSSGTKK